MSKWMVSLMAVGCILFAADNAVAQRGGPPLPAEASFFVKKASWLETMQASREALARQEQAGKRESRGLETIFHLSVQTFPDQLTLRQQRLEDKAGIWIEGWKEGDVAELARRYAEACAPAQKELAAKLAQACKNLADLRKVRDLFYLQHAITRLELARKTLAFVEQQAARPEFAAQLKNLEKQLAEGQLGGEALYAQACQLRRNIILSHPLLDFNTLLLNKRSGFLIEHMCDQYLGRHSKAAPGLIALENWKENPQPKVLLEGLLPAGATMHPDLSFDGRRVLFAYADHTKEQQNQLRGYFIYEYSFDTGQVRQVTGTRRDQRVGQRERETVLIEDMDPCYLPDGGLAFISTRSQQYGRCHGTRYVPSYTMYRGEMDGTGIRPLSYNESNEWGPSVLPDGSLVYTRWDYVNRHDTIYQSLWTMRPDGTQTAHYYGNYSIAPCLIGEGRAIPQSNKVVATAAAHHGQTLGTIIAIDPRKGQEHGRPLVWITPELRFPESGVPEGITSTAMPLPEDIPFNYNAQHTPRRSPTVIPSTGRAATPWPLSEDLYLCTYQHGPLHAIYLVDSLGGRELIHTDAQISCFDPIPLKRRPTPPVIPSAVTGKEKEKTGVFVVQDLYRSTQPIPPGTIKSLRVNEIISQPTAAVPPRSYVHNEIVKKILGTVPVNEDGSVAFEAPANVPMQFQLLDENGMAVMTMRSLVYLQPGERATCVGCHGPRNNTKPPAELTSLAVHKIKPPVGPQYAGGFSFVRTVQPVLDRYCIGCHGLDKTAGGIDLTGVFGNQQAPGVKLKDGRKSLPWASAAYQSLLNAPGLVKVAQRNQETAYSQPKDYFAHAGLLAKMLLAGHPNKEGKKRVQLDRDSFQRIADWLDVNAQFFGDYSHNRIETQPPLVEGERVLRAAIAKRFGQELAQQPFAALVNVANPAESRILMAPLPTAAGGWDQIKKGAYSGRDDAAFQELARLVAASITPLPYRDVAGTCGRDSNCRCGNCWVRQLKLGQR